MNHYSLLDFGLSDVSFLFLVVITVALLVALIKSISQKYNNTLLDFHFNFINNGMGIVSLIPINGSRCTNNKLLLFSINNTHLNDINILHRIINYNGNGVRQLLSIADRLTKKKVSRSVTISKENEGEPKAFKASDINILIVDDLLPNRTITRIILHENGFNYVEAENGEEALSLIEETNPDIILMDIHMPILDGVETMLKIRSNSWKYQHIPIIALTTASQKRKDEFIDKGFTDYIQKPFREEEILDCIKKALTK